MTVAYVIESEARDQNGVRQGTFRHYVADEARAQDECTKAPGRTYRKLVDDEIPEVARKNIERAALGA